jgi:hypothetical protein
VLGSVRLSFFDEASPIYTRARYLPPSQISHSRISRSVISEGCRLDRCVIEHCVLGLRLRVEEGAVLEDTLAVSVDNALLQAGTEEAMQGRINAIANLTQGLQSLSLAAAGYTIHLLANGHRFGSGYQPVQVGLGLALLGVVAWLVFPQVERRLPPPPVAREPEG